MARRTRSILAAARKHQACRFRPSGCRLRDKAPRPAPRRETAPAECAARRRGHRDRRRGRRAAARWARPARRDGCRGRLSKRCDSAGSPRPGLLQAHGDGLQVAAGQSAIGGIALGQDEQIFLLLGQHDRRWCRGSRRCWPCRLSWRDMVQPSPRENISCAICFGVLSS